MQNRAIFLLDANCHFNWILETGIEKCELQKF